mgnify:CR=1 FL=1
MEIRLYIEGGGNSKDTKSFLLQGFRGFLRDLVSEARSRRIQWRPVMCGPRQAAFDAFRIALRQHPDALNVLLVDAEGPVQDTPWRHLGQRDGWECNGWPDDQCHLMTQAMEAWFIADIATLATFYGVGFNPNSIPKNPDVEQVAKIQLETSLKAATRGTQKGESHQIYHASRLLAVIDATTVRRASRHCDRLFTAFEIMMKQ